MASGEPLSGKFTWRIENFSWLGNVKVIYSDFFTVGGFKWRVMLFPNGNNTDHLSMYLDVADGPMLPDGWSTYAHFSLSVVNQYNSEYTVRKETQHRFHVGENDWGFTNFMRLVELYKPGRDYRLDDTVLVEAEVAVLQDPSVVTVTNRFESFFIELREFISTAENSGAKEGSGSNSGKNDLMNSLISASPSLEEVQKAKDSLKECLSDLFKLNVKDRLWAALSTLSRAEVGLSCDQQKSIKNFRENFDDFISDFLTFEKDNAEFELQRLARDQLLEAMKKNHETHLSNKQLLESLTAEGEELKKRTEEVEAEKEKLISCWGSLMTESEEAKSKYTAQEKELADAEEKKRIAEERMSRSTVAWSSLKAHFL